MNKTLKTLTLSARTSRSTNDVPTTPDLSDLAQPDAASIHQTDSQAPRPPVTIVTKRRSRLALLPAAAPANDGDGVEDKTEDQSAVTSVDTTQPGDTVQSAPTEPIDSVAAPVDVTPVAIAEEPVETDDAEPVWTAPTPTVAPVVIRQRTRLATAPVVPEKKIQATPTAPSTHDEPPLASDVAPVSATAPAKGKVRVLNKTTTKAGSTTPPAVAAAAPNTRTSTNASEQRSPASAAAPGRPGRKPSVVVESDEVAEWNAAERAEMRAARVRKTVARKIGGEGLDKYRKQLAALIKLGKERGYLTHAEIHDHLPDDVTEPETIAEILRTIEDMSIAVYDQAPDDAILLLSDRVASGASDDEVEAAAATAISAFDGDFGRSTDPVRMYMREMSTAELLTREGEIEIAKREIAKRHVRPPRSIVSAGTTRPRGACFADAKPHRRSRARLSG